MPRFYGTTPLADDGQTHFSSLSRPLIIFFPLATMTPLSLLPPRHKEADVRNETNVQCETIRLVLIPFVENIA